MMIALPEEYPKYNANPDKGMIDLGGAVPSQGTLGR